ncbi:oligosaccharide flippase family protein [Clostridium sp. DL1XJH146]
MIKNVFRVLFSNFIVVIVGLINGLVFPKLLTIEEYAIYQTFLLYASYIGIMHLGFPSGLFVKYGGKDYLKKDNAQYKSEIYFLIITQLFFAIVFGVISVFLKNEIMFYVSMCIIPMNVVITYKSLYQAWNQFKKFSVINSITSISICLLMIVLSLMAVKSDARFAIFPYIIVNMLCSIYMIFVFIKDTKGIKTKKICSDENLNTLKTGFFLMLGGAVSLLFYSIDRFFIKALFNSYEFAMYSFALSMQSIMNVFISAIAKPLYPKMVADKAYCNNEFSKIKEVLILFGSLSGCAYFACSIIVKSFIPQYIESLKVISIFFAIFPVLTVINCLYINLYKATRQIKKYLITLIIMIIISIILNVIGVLIYKNYISISIATTICYYIWFWYSSRHFNSLKLSKFDYIYLIGFLILFFVSTRVFEDIFGLIIFLILILFWGASIYSNSFKEIISNIRKIIMKWV